MALSYARVAPDDMEDWLELALKLWPDASREGLRGELGAALNSPKDAGFMVRTPAGEAVAFMNLSLRYDYVPGVSAYPVAYVEGIYVANAFRRQGVAGALLGRAEAWAKAKNCVNLASDTTLENTQSQVFHEAAGFREVERVVCFVKTLDQRK